MKMLGSHCYMCICAGIIGGHSNRGRGTGPAALAEVQADRRDMNRTMCLQALTEHQETLLKAAATRTKSSWALGAKPQTPFLISSTQCPDLLGSAC